ncbi:hypothetical protein FA09DRAFT_302176 [Tilletiopsis washingtonensis]|uniref:Hypervirulence associated protein TUDOR domain-containing protein n=1 Tax=Tilletiopsis washingtonensis TaxID=58919 RepID=A0A316Z1T2_9BASI|nr:hypothetical protein FA09DRAFT_302176 [Tilletiopsis washingtonensis]PWN95054.1 hypothetical protein FA09DRAFT_302176 [Tilletiopsis washingtonensis]
MPTDPQDLQKGDEVSWKWGAGHPKGEVKDVVEDKATITTKRGSEVTRDGSEEDPAVIVKTQNGSDGIKYAHELDGVNPSK